ncbi:MAG: [FeFe] hydrogenase H-cluster maturation GTPase HydF [Oscillospiraceae bacterium]|nr:[FeFe] hydrogenase H-cluster maturation GTPase HydF [Oscillospiraceae bacterium]
MGLNSTPSSERIHIAFFGKRNAGKSSLVNAVTGQNISVVSEIKGTTTDPVYKSMELLPAGPVMIIDTPGFDDSGYLGEMRIKKAEQVLRKTDIAVLVVSSEEGLSEEDRALRSLLENKKIPYITVFSKSDLTGTPITELNTENEIQVSSSTGHNITELKNMIAALADRDKNERKILGDIISPSDIAVLVVPVDEAAPKGRLILPQQMIIREILDKKAVPVITQPETFSQVISYLIQKPRIVITDSQAFGEISAKTPEDIPLTSFSILMANYKGVLQQAVSGLKAIDNLKDGDRILISEGCTHHRQCGDIGTVKLPALIKKYTGVSPEFTFTSGTEFPENIRDFSLIIHCGACMLNEREVRARAGQALNADIPFTNYGTAISYMNGIIRRTLGIFPDILDIL